MRNRWLHSILAFGLLLIGIGSAHAQQQPCAQSTMPKIIASSSYQVTTADRCGLIILTNTGAISVVLPAPGLIFAPTFKVTVLPLNGGTVTFSGLPDQAGIVHKINGQTTLALGANQGAELKIEQDNNWYTSIFGGLPGVSGPSASVDGHVASFSGTTGKTIQDSGIASSSIALYAVNNAALIALPTTTASKAIRGGVLSAGDAPQQLFISETGTCAANGLVNDIGHCNNASDGGSWYAPFTSVVDAREFGLIFDGTAHAGSATALEAAITATAGKTALWIPPGSGCLVLDGQITLPSNATLLGPGRHSGACIEAEANLSVSGELFNTGASPSNIILKGFEINGNKANEVAQTWTCLTTGFVTNLNLDLYGHDCPSDGVYTAGTHVKIRGDYFDNGGRDVVTGGGSTATSDLDVDVSVGGSVSGAYSCVGICQHFTVTVRCQNADTGGTGSDCATGYNGANAYGNWNVVCDTSGNFCLHIGGSNQHFALTCISPSFACVDLASLTVLDPGPGTVTTAGTTAIVGNGTSFTTCPHNCQNATTLINPKITIAGVQYTIDHCADDTHCTATTTIPTATNVSYSMEYDSAVSSITGTVNGISPGNSYPCVQGIELVSSSISGTCRTAAKGVELFASEDDEINIGVNGATNTGISIQGGAPFTTGTVTATNGSATVVGSGTSWLSELASGDVIRIATDTASYTVSSVTDDTHIVLTTTYGGSAPGGSAYRAAWPSSRLRLGGFANSGTGSGVSVTDGTLSDISTTANSNGAYGYTEGGVSGLSGPNCYHGQAAGNVTAAYSLNSGSLHGNCLP